MQREIGSNFWIKPELLQKKIKSKINFSEYSDYVLTSTGRSAEGFILDKINETITEKIALLPPFTCHTVIEPFLQRNYKIYTYAIDENLNVNGEMLRFSIEKTNAQIVFMHRYFGFDTIKNCDEIMREFSEKGVIFIEDHTQSMYSSHKSLPAEYHMGSFRKWLGIPDGGFAACKNEKFFRKPEVPDTEMVRKKLDASFLKDKYMNNLSDDKTEFLRKYREAEDLLNSQKQIYRMSDESQILLSNADAVELKYKRRQNYSYLYDVLSECKKIKILTPKLSESDVPLYLAVETDDRNGLQTLLRKHDIFAPIVWEKAGIVPEICGEAEYIYRHILCLPIDQRYDVDDMERMTKTVKDFEVNLNG